MQTCTACKCSLERTVMAAKGAILPLSSLALCNIIGSTNWFLINTNLILLTMSFSLMLYVIQIG